MKIKLDHYDLTVLINGLNTMRVQYSQQTNDYLCNLLLRIIDIYDNNRPKRKARIDFNNDELHVIRLVLIDWRNQFITTGHLGAADGVGDLLLKFV